jgi:hypothetical protein
MVALKASLLFRFAPSILYILLTFAILVGLANAARAQCNALAGFMPCAGRCISVTYECCWNRTWCGTGDKCWMTSRGRIFCCPLYAQGLDNGTCSTGFRGRQKKRGMIDPVSPELSALVSTWRRIAPRASIMTPVEF